MSSPREPVDPDLSGAPSQRAVLAAVAVGGVVGAELRYALGRLFPTGAASVPWATLAVNVSGALLIGVLLVLVTEVGPRRRPPHPLLRPLLGTGLLGGYTTFSTFAVDVVRLLDDGHAAAALTDLLLTPVAAVLAVAAGTALARRLAVAR